MILNITPIKAFSDNYIWAIHAPNCSDVVLVDPGQAEPCIAFIQQHQLQLSAILITHHHADHTGGVTALQSFAKKNGQDIKVYGPATESLPACDIKLKEHDKVLLSFKQNNKESHLQFEFSILDLPGHTAGHIAYVNEQALFCGDTLFSGGCGRLFEGTAAQMYHSLNKLKALPAQTPVYCTHEYTLSNLQFALAVEPDNKKLTHYYDQVKSLRSHNKTTLPSSILLETQINPFLRCEQKNIIKAASDYEKNQLNDSVAVFAAIRAWKDNF